MRQPAEESAASGVPSYKNRVAPGRAMTRQWVCISVQPQDIPMGTGTHQNGAGETPRALTSNQPPDGDSRNGSGYLFNEETKTWTHTDHYAIPAAKPIGGWDFSSTTFRSTYASARIRLLAIGAAKNVRTI